MDNSNVHQNKCEICLKVEMKDKLLIPKLDSLLKAHKAQNPKVHSHWIELSVSLQSQKPICAK
jgi:hypothetical protein